jgi:hypothetical protein
MIFYVKVGRSSFLRGASQKASIAHLCTPPRAPHRLLLPPPTMSTFASWMVPGKPSPPRQVCIVAVSSSHCVFCKTNHWFWLIFRGEKSFSASVIGGAWWNHVLSCSYDCNDGCLSLPRALFIALLFSRSFHNKNGHVCGIFQWARKVTLQFRCCFWYHAIIRVPSFLVMTPTMKCMTCFLPAAYTFVSYSFILSLCRWITLSLAARY